MTRRAMDGAALPIHSAQRWEHRVLHQRSRSPKGDSTKDECSKHRDWGVFTEINVPDVLSLLLLVIDSIRQVSNMSCDGLPLF